MDELTKEERIKYLDAAIRGDKRLADVLAVLSGVIVIAVGVVIGMH